MKLAELIKQKQDPKDAGIYSPDFYQELFNLNKSLNETDYLNSLDKVLESLPNIFPEIDNAVVLEKRDSKYYFINALAYDLEKLESESFALKNIYPDAKNDKIESRIYQEDKKLKSKLFAFLDKQSKTVKSRIIIPISFYNKDLLIVASAVHLEFSEVKKPLADDFRQEVVTVLEYKALEYDLEIKSQTLELFKEIRELCGNQSGLEKSLVYASDRLVKIFPKLKTSLYIFQKDSLNLIHNLGFEELQEKIEVGKKPSLREIEGICTKHCPSVSKDEKSLVLSIGLEAVDNSFALWNVVQSQETISGVEQGFIKSTVEQVKITIEHFLFYQTLFELEQRNLFISENMQGVVVLCDREGRIEYISPSIEKNTGYASSEIIANSLYDYIHPDDVEVFENGVARAGNRKPFKVLHRSLLASGNFIWVESTIKMLVDDRDNKEYLLITIQDNEGAKEAEEHLEYMGIHDSLTGLPNRGQLLKGLEVATEEKKERPQKIFALVLLNLDRFKNINDNMGHKVGDELLRRVAKRLEACVYSSDLVARIGGDEFAILLDDLPTNTEAKNVIERVNKEFSRSFFINNNEIYVSLSMGIAFINDLKLKPTEILRNADLALRVARKTDDGYRIFNHSMLNNYKNKTNVEADLQVALKENQLFLVYQPMFDLIRRRVAGFEALIRWNHPKRGLVSPVDFIPIAEESGLILDIDYWVLENSAKQLKSWNLRFDKTKDMFISINLSARNVVLETSAKEITKSIKNQGIDPHNIKLEVTEGVLMNNMRVASNVLSDLRAEGFRIQLDDFGTGYSSLSYIQKLPIDSLKIDQSFIRRMDGGKQDEAIVQAILALGAGLNLEVVAEGVETPYQLERLTEMNCDYGQGYLISRPQITKEIEKRFFI